MGKTYAENSLKRFLKRKVKITAAFVVSFLITGAVGYSEIIDKTVEISENEFGKIIVQLPNEALEFDKNNNTWTFNDVIDVQSGNGIWIGDTVRNFNIINNGIIKANGNGKHSGNGIYINGAEISSLTNKGVISGNGSENISSNGIYNKGTIETLTNNGIISGNSKNGDNSGNGIHNNGAINTLTNNGVITGNESGINPLSRNGVFNQPQKIIIKLENNGIILGNENGGDSGNGIYNSYFGTITTLENTGVILGNGNNNGNKSNNGIYNSSGTINTLTNTGIVLGSGNGYETGNGIFNAHGTIETLNNVGIIAGNKSENENSSNNGIFNTYGTIKLTNTGIIAGSNKAVNNDYGTITNQENYGLLIDGAGTENQKITAGTGGKIENSQTEFDGYTVMNGKITDDNKKTENISVSSAFSSEENTDRHIFNLADSSFIADKDFTLTNGIINSYQSQKDGATVQITGKTVFKTENVTFNSVNSAIEKDNSPVVIMGDGENNTLVLAGKSQINGEIDLAGGDDDKIFFEKSLNPNTKADNSEEVYIHHNIKGAEQIIFNNNTTLFETAKITGAEKIYIGDGGQLTLRVDGTEKDGDKVIGHGLYGENGDDTIISSTANGKLNINFIGGQNENIISFGSNKLENIVVDFTNPLFFADNEGKNPTSEIKVSVNKDLSGVIGTPDNSKKETDIDISLYNKLDKIFKSMYSVNGLLPTEFTGLTDDTKGEFLKYLHDIYAGNPYAYSSELSRKTMDMMRNLADRDLHPEINKWVVYGGLSHIDGGTKESFYGRNYYGYDTGSRDIETDTKITGGYFKAEYGKSDSVTTGIIFGGNNAESEIGNSKAEGDSFYFGGYAKKFVNDFRFILGAGFQHGDYKADRTAVGYEGITATRSYSENYHDRGFDIYGDIRYSKEIGDNLFFEPSFTLSYTYLDQDGAAENGTLAIETDSKNFDYLSSEINLDVRKTILVDKLTHSFIAGISYERLLNGYDEEYITGRVIGGTNFDILVPEKEKDNFLLNAKYELETEKGMLFDLKCSYRFEHDNNQDEWTVGAGAGYKF